MVFQDKNSGKIIPGNRKDTGLLLGESTQINLMMQEKRMTEKEKALEEWHLEEHLHLPRTGSDATEGFDAGWDAAMKSKEVKELKTDIKELLEMSFYDMIGEDFEILYKLREKYGVKQ